MMECDAYQIFLGQIIWGLAGAFAMLVFVVAAFSSQKKP